MFKRVEKKLAKRKEGQGLCASRNFEEVPGFDSIDSDDSISDAGSEAESDSDSSSPQTRSKRKRSFSEELDDNERRGSGDAGSGDEPGIQVQMTVEEALHNPLYIVSMQPDVRGCIACSHKILKNDTMVSVHMSSRVSRASTPIDSHDNCRQAHLRRVSKLREVAAFAKPDDDAGEVLSVAFASTPLRPKSPSDTSTPLSRRAAKRVSEHFRSDPSFLRSPY